MSRKGWLLAGLLALGLAACGAPTDVLDSLPTLAPTIVAAEDPGAELRDPGASSSCDALDGSVLNSGRLAVVCNDDNIYVVDSDGGPPLAVTDDAVGASTGMVRQYHSPTWSAGGWLSYVMAEAEAGSGSVKNVVYAVQPGGTPRQLLETDASNYVYGYWSPAECGQGPACGRLAFLMSAQDAIELHMAEVRGDTEEVEEQKLGEGGPFYYSWAPDGERMLWFRGGTMLEVVDLSHLEDSIVLPDEPGVFQAPWWSPVDERWLFASAGESGNHLVVADGDERSDFVSDGAALSAFAWSPDGRQFAYAEGFPPSPYPFATLSVRSDGDQDGTLLAEEPFLAFFWSPDSQKVAFVGLELAGPSVPEASASGTDAAPAQQQILLVWKVADVTTGDVRELVSFAPTRSELYLIQFFDQFAQSHNVWSPDSSQIVYAEQLPSGVEHVSVVDVDSPNARPTLVGEGSLGVFSYN